MYRKGELCNSGVGIVGQLPFFWASAAPRGCVAATRGGTRLKKMGTAGGGGDVGDCSRRGRMGRILGRDGA